MANTSRLSLRYPVASDTADVPRDIGNLASDIDNAAIFSKGVFASRPTSTVGSPGIDGRYYFATDTSRLYIDTGTSWIEVATTGTIDTAIPIGSVQSYAGTSAPTNWLLCDGSQQAVATYGALDSVLGTTYGARTNGSGGAGSTHFRLPDLRGRVPAGKDNMGGTAASRLTNSGTGNPGVDGSTLGASGGVDRHTMTAAEMPSHSHNYDWDNAGNGAGGIGVVRMAANSGQQPSSTAGSDNAHPNAQPTLVLNYIIRAL